MTSIPTAKNARKKIFGADAEIFVLGVVSFLTDVSSEMIFSVLSVFLTVILGASALVLGLMEGLADFVASSLDFVSGYFSDKTGKRKVFALFGYSFSPGNIGLHGSPSAMINLGFGDIMFVKNTIPFYITQPQVRHVFNLGSDNHYNPVVDVPPIAANIYLTLKDKPSTPRAVFNAFKASDMVELCNDGFTFAPFVDCLGNKRIIDGEPYESNDKGGLFVRLAADDLTELNDIAAYLDGGMLAINADACGITLKYSGKAPEKINEADIAVINEIRKNT